MQMDKSSRDVSNAYLAAAHLHVRVGERGKMEPGEDMALLPHS